MRKVLITGASGDIGTELCFLYAKKGFHVIAHYNNNETQALNIKNKITTYGGVCETIKCDITKEDEVINMREKIKFVDILINNAAFYQDEDFYNKDLDVVKRVLETNLAGTYLVSREISKIMNEGVIINISSNNALNSNYQESIDYDMSKIGLISLTNNLADLLSPKIRVVSISPGWVNTKKNDIINKDFRTNEESKILLKRFANLDEITEVIYFISSEKASYINKTNIVVDGGIR